ncbi:hypothetical protein BX600DRAFT_431799 [Xylariales sp. PMI_506]|nr:hypothetical protein BX600DRAFT_431799 [Xylariales sp. PMI_506]
MERQRHGIAQDRIGSSDMHKNTSESVDHLDESPGAILLRRQNQMNFVLGGYRRAAIYWQSVYFASRERHRVEIQSLQTEIEEVIGRLKILENLIEVRALAYDTDWIVPSFNISETSQSIDTYCDHLGHVPLSLTVEAGIVDIWTSKKDGHEQNRILLSDYVLAPMLPAMEISAIYAIVLFSGFTIASSISLARLTTTNRALTHLWVYLQNKWIFDELGILHACVLLGYITANGIILGYTSNEIRSLQRSSAQLALINLIPLFSGGRTSMLFDRIGLSMQAYHTIRRWTGGIGIAEAFIHCGIAMHRDLTYLSSSGVPIIVSFILLTITLWSTRISPLMRFHELLYKVQQPLAILALSLIEWHVATLSPSVWIVPTVLLGTWAALSGYRILRVLTAGKCTLQSVETYGPGCLWKLQAEEAFQIYPGCCFFIYNIPFSLPARFFGHPMLLFASSSNPGDKTGQVLEFFIQSPKFDRPGLITSRLYIDGPYGKNLHAEEYETVILAGQGFGTTSVLPFVSHLTKLNRDKMSDNRVLSLSKCSFKNCLTRRMLGFLQFEDDVQKLFFQMRLKNDKTSDLHKAYKNWRAYVRQEETTTQEFTHSEKLDYGWDEKSYPSTNYDLDCLTNIQARTEGASRSVGRSILIGEWHYRVLCKG